MTKILDCTLRDGGYYTGWNFNTSVVDTYIKAMNSLPIDYLEVGYRNNPSDEYLGKFGYTPVSVLTHIREHCDKGLAVMLNEKSTRPTDLRQLLGPIVGLADMVRIAIDPAYFDRAVVLARDVKTMGFKVGFNCMYMSKWNAEYKGFISKLRQLDDFCDLFCMVDSFGGVTPEDVENIYCEVKANTSVPIGFHGHNNLQLGLINTMTAMNLGCDYVDATVLGMGRGAGNLNTELLLTFLNAHYGLDVDFNVLGDVVFAFKPLMDKYQWGINLPYMIAGANCIPQKVVMDWVTNRAYSFNSIVRALDNRKNKQKDNARYPIFNAKHCDRVLIIGGGKSCLEHQCAVKEFLSYNPEMPIIFVTARHASIYNSVSNPKFYCLVGNEAKRLSGNIHENEFNGICVLPPYPRLMGTEVPGYAEHVTYELGEITFTSAFPDSCTTLALQTALSLGAKEVNIIGYDGYMGAVLSEKEMDLSNENKTLFEFFKEIPNVKLISLTPSLYKSLEVQSIYQFL